MTANDLFTVGARLLGVYFVVAGLALLPSGAEFYTFVENGFTTETFLYALISVSQAVIFVVSGLILLIRNTPKSGEDTDPLIVPALSQIVGLQLIGLYFAIVGFVNVVASIATALVMHDGWHMGLPTIVSSSTRMILGILVFLRAGPIAAFASRMSSKIATVEHVKAENAETHSGAG